MWRGAARRPNLAQRVAFKVDWHVGFRLKARESIGGLYFVEDVGCFVLAREYLGALLLFVVGT